jgi:hypothetical protein
MEEEKVDRQTDIMEDVPLIGARSWRVDSSEIE